MALCSGQELGQEPTLACPWRILLHGKLHIGNLLCRTGTGTPAQHACPHACCSALPAMLTHIFVTCLVASAVVAWVSATLGALTREAGPPHSADLLVADDRRKCLALKGSWQRLRLPVLPCLLTAYRPVQAQRAA